MPTQSVITGQQMEKAAAYFLSQQQLKPVASNFKCRYGEIDLIMRSKTEIIFVEVRFRKNANFGLPHETVTFQKQKKLVLAASVFLAKYPKAQQLKTRFDVLGITPKGESELNFHWIKNAFYIQ